MGWLEVARSAAGGVVGVKGRTGSGWERLGRRQRVMTEMQAAMMTAERRQRMKVEQRRGRGSGDRMVGSVRELPKVQLSRRTAERFKTNLFGKRDKHCVCPRTSPAPQLMMVLAVSYLESCRALSPKFLPDLHMHQQGRTTSIQSVLFRYKYNTSIQVSYIHGQPHSTHMFDSGSEESSEAPRKR